MKKTIFILFVIFIIIDDFALAQFYLPQTTKYQVEVKGNLKVELLGKPSKSISNNSIFDYSNLEEGPKLKLVINQLTVDIGESESKLTYIMNRSQFIRKSDRETVVPYADANDAIKSMLQDTFETPLCIIVLDPEGRETNRTLISGSGAKDFIQKGMIEYCRFFHVRLPKTTNIWDESRTLPLFHPILSNMYVKGNLQYVKIRQAGEFAEIELRGTLTNPNEKIAEDSSLQNAVYEVKGKQRYNVSRSRWENGEANINISYDLIIEGKKIKHTGDITLILRKK